MKKIYLFIIIGLLLVGSIVAVSIVNKNVSLSEGREIALSNAGAGLISYEDYYDIENNLYSRCLIVEDFEFSCSYFMEEVELDVWMEKRIEDLADEIIESNNRIEPEIVSGGSVTLDGNK